MSKVIGAIFTLIGFLLTLLVIFLLLNSSVLLPYYDGEPKSIIETGYLIPGIIGLFLLTVGLIFLLASKEDPFVEY